MRLLISRATSGAALIRSAAAGWVKHGAMEMAAAISYYAAFSLAPLLVIAIAIAGAVFDGQRVREEVAGQFGSMIGAQGKDLIQTLIENASKPREGVLPSLLGIGLLVFAASSAFGQLRESLDRIWEVPVRPGQGVWRFLRERFLSFSMVLVIGFLLLVSLAISALLAGVSKWAGGVMPAWTLLLSAVNLVVSFAVITVLFAMIFRFLPTVRIRWKDVWFGAAVTSVLFAMGKSIIGLYLGRASPGSVYGAAGSLAVLLIWVYYSSLIFLFGAEITRAHADQSGRSSKAAAQ